MLFPLHSKAFNSINLNASPTFSTCIMAVILEGKGKNIRESLVLEHEIAILNLAHNRR